MTKRTAMSTAKDANESLTWSRSDGVAYHTIIGGHAEERWEYETTGIDVDVEMIVQRRNQENEIVGSGRIDLLIDERHVIDFKTDQMDKWTAKEAGRMGDQYGDKVASYARSPQVESDAKGHLIMVGRRPADPKVEHAFREAAARHNVSVIFCENGDPNKVLDRIENDILQRQPEKPQLDLNLGQSKAQHEPLVGEQRAVPRDEHAEQYRTKMESNSFRALVNWYKRGRQEDKVTYSEVRKDAPVIENEKQGGHQMEGVGLLTAGVFAFAFVKKRAESWWNKKQADLEIDKDEKGK